MHLNNGLDIPPRNPDILETSILEILRTYNASMWLAGPTAGEGNYVDSLGTIPLAGANEAIGYVDDQLSKGEAENAVYNSNFLGASIGVSPTGYSVFPPPGTTATVVGLGTLPGGMQYVDVRVVGTSSAASDYVLFEPLSGVGGFLPAVLGDICIASLYVGLVGGSWPTRALRIAVIERNAGGTFLSWNPISDIRGSVPDENMVRVSFSHVCTQATTARATLAFRLAGVQIGDVMDFTMRYAGPQLNKGNMIGFIGTGLSQILRTENYIPAIQATTARKAIMHGGIRNELIHSRSLSGWALFGPLTVTPNEGSGVEGQNNATHIVRTGSTAAYATRAFLVPASGVFTASAAVVAKPGVNGRFLTVRLQGTYPAFVDIMFDMHAGAVVYTGVLGGGVLVKHDISRLPNGYWLLRAVATINMVAGGQLAFCPREVYNPMDSATNAGDVSDVYIDNTAMGLSEDFIQYPFPVTTAAGLHMNQAPYSWKFDGVDDRLELTRQAIDPAVNHFFIVAFKMPPTPITIATWVVGIGNAGVSERAGLVFLANNQVVAFWRDTGAVNINSLPLGASRAVNEKLVAVARRSGANFHGSVRGDVNAPVTQSAAVALNAWVPTMSAIGAGISTGSVNFFFNSLIYGVIEGNGNPSAGELLAMENFLAGHAGFTPLP